MIDDWFFRSTIDNRQSTIVKLNLPRSISGLKPFLPYIVIVLILLVLPLRISRFYIYILPVIFVTSLLAMSLNLVVGHGGLYQFHHAAFYGVGAYTFALILTWTSLPFWAAFVAGPFVAAVVGFLIGWFCVRLSKLYFGMLQISLGSLIWVIVLRWYDLTHGDDGIHGIPKPSSISSSKNSYYFILLVLIICLVALYLILKSPFGTTLQAIRDNPTFFAGVAGVLYVVLDGSVFPNMMFWVLSLEILIMCLLGGWFTFAGPVLGAAIMVSLKTFVGAYTEYWTLVLGVILILLIFFLPEGVMGYLSDKMMNQQSKGDKCCE